MYSDVICRVRIMLWRSSGSDLDDVSLFWFRLWPRNRILTCRRDPPYRVGPGRMERRSWAENRRPSDFSNDGIRSNDVLMAITAAAVHFGADELPHERRAIPNRRRPKTFWKTTEALVNYAPTLSPPRCSSLFCIGPTKRSRGTLPQRLHPHPRASLKRQNLHSSARRCCKSCWAKQHYPAILTTVDHNARSTAPSLGCACGEAPYRMLTKGGRRWPAQPSFGPRSELGLRRYSGLPVPPLAADPVSDIALLFSLSHCYQGTCRRPLSLHTVCSGSSQRLVASRRRTEPDSQEHGAHVLSVCGVAPFAMP